MSTITRTPPAASPYPSTIISLDPDEQFLHCFAGTAAAAQAAGTSYQEITITTITIDTSTPTAPRFSLQGVFDDGDLFTEATDHARYEIPELLANAPVSVRGALYQELVQGFAAPQPQQPQQAVANVIDFAGFAASRSSSSRTAGRTR